MTRIEQMIKDMCPYGVEYKKLGEVCELKRGSGITESQAIEGDVPVIAGGQKPAYYHNQSNREGLNITIAGSGAYAGYVAFWEQPIFVSDAFTVSPKDTSLDIKFVYYFLKNIQPQIHNTKKGSGVPHVHPSSISDFEIPIPPLEIQKKIVECLDKFSALAAELQAELQMRRKQYEYYRTQLLTPHSDCNSVGDSTDDCNWEWKTLGEIASFKYGYTAKAKESGNTRYIRITDIDKNGCLTQEAKYLDMTPDAKEYILQKGDVVMARTGATFGKTLYYNENYTSVYASFLIKIILDASIINSRYYWHFAQSQLYWEQANKLVGGGAQPQFNAGAVSQIQCPVPSLDEQARIVAILDKFEALTTSLSDGIPAEQAAQQKRYEYYRDLLLTFPRKAV